MSTSPVVDLIAQLKERNRKKNEALDTEIVNNNNNKININNNNNNNNIVSQPTTPITPNENRRPSRVWHPLAGSQTTPRLSSNSVSTDFIATPSRPKQQLDNFSISTWHKTRCIKAISIFDQSNKHAQYNITWKLDDCTLTLILNQHKNWYLSEKKNQFLL